MKSIRLSLIVYFLVLLAGALGAVSFFVYERTAKALDARLETSRELLQQEFELRVSAERRKVDDELLHHAYALANAAVSESRLNNSELLKYTPLGLLSALSSPFGFLQAPGWLSESSPGSRVFWELRAVIATEMVLNDRFLDRDFEAADNYYQISSWRGRSFRSRSLGARSLPVSPEEFLTLKRYEPQFDEFDLSPGVHVRSVTLKAPITRFLTFFPVHNRSRGGRPRDPGPGPPPPPRNPDMGSRPAKSSLPSMIIQCAADTTQRDNEIARLQDELKSKLNGLEKESRDTLFGLRLKLLWIGLTTFAAICVGGSLLIGLGLAPLQRLSEAVSKVSEKDFRLQYEEPPPPKELQPIVSRLRQTLDALQRAFDREKQASADISHELRTPIAGLMTTIDVALRKPRTADEYRKTLQECRDIVKQTSNLVERLLTLSAIDARSDQLRPELVDAAELAEQCATIIRPLANAHGLAFQLHQTAPTPIRTDPDKLREVMSNLMHNAVEYNRPDGAVNVWVKGVEGGLDFEVQDTGIGIAPEQRDQIFERFFRADPSRQATGLHAGLGLAIVRGYVELMGGRITVESELGKGSTFRVHIPTLANGTERRQHA